jgi:sugar phosphate isomerase/epimerase
MFDTGASYFNGCTISFPDFLGMCADLNMHYVEIQMEPPFSPPEIDAKLKAQVISELASHSLVATVHGPYDDINLSSFKESIRRGSLDIMKYCIDFAVDIESPIIVIHGGSCSIHQILRYEDAVQRFRASLLELAMYAHDRGIRIGVENKQLGIDREIILYPDEHFDIVQEYADYDVVAVIDTGHANTASINLPAYIRKMKPYLWEVHLHDNDGSSDSHMALGEGSSDLKGVLRELKAIKFKGPVILELDTREDFEIALAFIHDNL